MKSPLVVVNSDMLESHYFKHILRKLPGRLRGCDKYNAFERNGLYSILLPLFYVSRGFDCGISGKNSLALSGVSYSGDDLGLCITERVVSSVLVVRQWKSHITRWEHYCTEEEEEEDDDTLNVWLTIQLHSLYSLKLV